MLLAQRIIVDKKNNNATFLNTGTLKIRMN